jgi:cobalt-zinc-cadmium resistance protein CzcA
VKELNEKLLPPDVKVVPYLDRTTLIERTTHTVGKTLAEGMIVVTLVLLLFLGSPRAALIVALTIPMALLLAFVFMHHAKIPAICCRWEPSTSAFWWTVLRGRGREHSAPPRGPEGQALDAARCHLGHAAGGAPHLLRHVRDRRCLSAAVRFRAHRVQAVLAHGQCRGAALVGALAVALLLTPGLAWMAFRRPRKIFHNPVLFPGRAL